jgi:hypothetical protein
MSETADRLAALLNTIPPKLTDFSDAHASEKPAGGRWSKKEILGHLIDSAANNHQRFVRAQFATHLDIAGYQQEQWVSAQHYAGEPWTELVNLWLLLNRHLVHIIQRVPADCLPHTVSIAGRDPVTLEFVIDDYLRHLEHHLGQILH